MWFNLEYVPESSLLTATWIFRSEVVLDGVTVEDAWNYILTDPDDKAIQHWHPEVSKILWENPSKKNAAGTTRIVTFKDWLLMILLAGPIQIDEHVDIWDDGNGRGSDGERDGGGGDQDNDITMRRFGFYFKATTRPSFLTFKSGREEFKVEQVITCREDDGDEKEETGSGSNVKHQCVGVKFTRIVALEPAFLTRWVLGFVVHSRLKYVFETKCPRRLLAAFKEDKFGIHQPKKKSNDEGD